MKRIKNAKWFAFGLLIIFITLLPACTSGISQEDFDSLQNEYDEIQLKYNELSLERDEISLDRDRISSNRDSLIVELDDAVSNSYEYADELVGVKLERDRISKEFDEYKTSMRIYSDLSKEEAANRLVEEQRKETISELDSEIAEKQKQLDTLQNLIKKTGEDPIKLTAGYFYGGTDIPTGRYQVSNGSSNFVVHSSGGRLKVNIILGGRYGVDSYVFDVSSGDEIKSESPCTLTPIE